MTSTELEAVIRDVDKATQGPYALPMMNPNTQTDTASFRASLEVAYQLALLNEQICGVLNSRIPQVRVMCEPGDWPLQVQERNR